MSLRRGLEALPADRETESCVKHVLQMFRRHEGEWLTPPMIAELAGVPEACVSRVLETLAAASVLVRLGEPVRFSYTPDRLLQLEVDSFMRRAQAHSVMYQDNVARFRERYGR